MIGFLLAGLIAAQPAPPDFAKYPPCSNARARIEEPCTLPQRFDPSGAEQVIGAHSIVWWLHGDALTMIARPTKTPWVVLCCSLQTGLVPITGTDLAGVTVRIPHVDEAVLDISAAIGPYPTNTFRGANAPTAPARSDPLKGTLVSRVFFSPNLHEHRTVWIYAPPNVSAAHDIPTVYMADGGSKEFASIAEALILAKRIKPMILIGIEAAEPTRTPCYTEDCDRRAKEYEMDRDDASVPFQSHMRFLIDEVMPYVAAHYPLSSDRRDRVAEGSSQGGVWAAQAAELRADIFGAAIALSGTGSVELNVKALADSRIYSGAGEFEPDRLATMRHFAVMAHDAGAKVRFGTLWAGHSPLAWDVMIAEALQWLYPGETAR